MAANQSRGGPVKVNMQQTTNSLIHSINSGSHTFNFRKLKQRHRLSVSPSLFLEPHAHRFCMSKAERPAMPNYGC